jgi:hypothetical protein
LFWLSPCAGAQGLFLSAIGLQYRVEGWGLINPYSNPKTFKIGVIEVPTEKKIQIMDNLEQIFKQSDSGIMTDYRGL